VKVHTQLVYNSVRQWPPPKLQVKWVSAANFNCPLLIMGRMSS